MDTLERLRFAVDFAQENPKALRPGDVLNRKNDLKQFFARSAGDVVVLSKKEDPEKISDADLLDLRQRWHTLLIGLVALTDPAKEIPISHQCLEVRLSLVPVFDAGVGRGIVIADGSIADVATYMLLHCVLTEKPGTIQTCADAGCSRLFFRTRRQRFCSKKCAIRNAVTAHRKNVGKVKENSSIKAGKGRERAIRSKQPMKHKNPRG